MRVYALLFTTFFLPGLMQLAHGQATVPSSTVDGKLIDQGTIDSSEIQEEPSCELHYMDYNIVNRIKVNEFFFKQKHNSSLQLSLLSSHLKINVQLSFKN